MCRIELPSVSCGVPGLCHAAIGSASSSHGLGIVEGGSLAGNESASALSILRSRRQDLGFRRMACRRLVSASSGEVITTKTSLHRLSGFQIGDREICFLLCVCIIGLHWLLTSDMPSLPDTLPAMLMMPCFCPGWPRQHAHNSGQNL